MTLTSPVPFDADSLDPNGPKWQRVVAARIAYRKVEAIFNEEPSFTNHKPTVTAMQELTTAFNAYFNR